MFYKKETGNHGGEIIWSHWILTIVLVVAMMMVVIPFYFVWSKEMRGKADLAEAEWNRQISIREAEARLESEKLNAQSEIERAKGVAEANQIIAGGLRDNEEYLHYLWIQQLSKGNVIYVPTEAGLPILEAGKR